MWGYSHSNRVVQGGKGSGPGLLRPSLKISFVQNITSSSPGDEGPKELDSASASELMSGPGSRAG